VTWEIVDPRGEGHDRLTTHVVDLTDPEAIAALADSVADLDVIADRRSDRPVSSATTLSSFSRYSTVASR
jgi:hypothetical protein